MKTPSPPLARRPAHAHAFGPVQGYGADNILRRRWDTPVAPLGAGVRAWCCQCVDGDSSGQWNRAAAPYILRDAEWMIWSRLSPYPARQGRWLRGRVAAKDAVRLLLNERHGMVASLENIGILPDAEGVPRVEGAMPGTLAAGISISISHCNRTSAALAAERSPHGRRVGLDIASSTDDHDGLEEGGFAPAERDLLDACPAAERGDWILRMWCAKEAAAKAAGTGLRGNPLHVRVCTVDRAAGRIEVDLHPALRRLCAPVEPADRIVAHVHRDGELTFAVACFP